MLCEKCHQKPATVHMQQIVNGAKTEIHLCQDCSAQVDSPISMDALFNGLLGSILSMAVDNKQSSHKPSVNYQPCPICGMTFENFKSSGRFGCVECYRVFSKELRTILKNVQASNKHEGKYPKKYGHDMFQKKEAERMRNLMQTAIKEENFEEAARLRDEIKIIEIEGSGY